MIARHRLQLPRSTDPADVLAMVRNVRPGAELAEDGAIALGEGARLLPDPSPRGAGRFTLEVERDREDPLPDGMVDSHGYGRAFGDGLPFRDERHELDLLWSLARRLQGAVVTDGGTRLEPHPFAIRDLTVVSPDAIDAASLSLLIAPLEPEAELDEVPGDADTTGYGATIPLDDGGMIALTVGPAEPHPALAALGWLDRAVDYRLRHLPEDEAEDAVEVPDPATAARWELVYRRIGLLAATLEEGVGGYVIDGEGLLVDPRHLG